MLNLAQNYQPITANPSQTNEYKPCEALEPYIRCFWGSKAPQPHLEGSEYSAEEASSHRLTIETIIPDTCMDIIWNLDELTGKVGAFFSGINDVPFEVPVDVNSNVNSVFAIRFHFWAVHCFADDHLRDVLNAHVEVDQYFSSFHKELSSLLANTSSMTERITVAEAYLLRRLERGFRTHDSMMNAIYTLIKGKGVVSIKDLQYSSGLSSRQLERIFQEFIGVSPKKAADLVRFQNVWQELYHPSTHIKDIQDIIIAYGFSHQSHFINSFKKYAGRTPLEALAYAGK